jgi:PAS domain S-box-containing protein
MTNNSEKPFRGSLEPTQPNIGEIGEIEIIPGGMPVEAILIIYDVLRDEKGEIINLILRDANEYTVKEIGLPLEYIVNKPATDMFMTKTILTSRIEILREVMATGKGRQFEMHLPWNGKHFLTSIIPLSSETIIITALNITERKRAEQSLRASEARYRALVYATSSAVWRLSADGTMQLNPVGSGVIDEPAGPEEPRGNWLKAIHPGDQTRAYETWRRAVETKSFYEVEYRKRISDGSYHWFLSRGVPVFNEEGDVLEWIGANVDITERKLAEEALKENEERLRLALEGAGAGMWVRDLDGGWEATSQLNILFGLPATDPPMRESDLSFLVYPMDLPFFEKSWRTVIEQGGHYEQEYRVIWPDGSIHWLASKGRVSNVARGLPKFIGITYDITTHKEMEEILFETMVKVETYASELDATISSIAAGVIIYDNTGNIVRMNEFACNTFGFSINDYHLPDQARKANLILYKSDGTHYEAEETPLYRALQGKIIHNEEIVIAKTPDKPIWFSGTLAPIRDSNNNSLGVIFIFIDISERKQAEEALKESEERYRILAEELCKADQNKNEFLAVLSHELRNPLASIQNSLSILDRAAPGAEQAKRAKAIIDRQFGQLARLVDDLLDITRITQNKIQLRRQRLELNELVRQTVDDHRSVFEMNGICLEAQFTASPIFVNADGDRLAQVVGNLLQNAAKFTGRGGSTRVSIESDASRQQAVIRVIDNGVGMAPELISHLFQPFMQADTTLERSHGGLGLGLTLSKGIVEMHGGDVNAYSAGPGKGSEFVVRLPLEDILTEEPQTISPDIPQCRRRVLIIDDNVDLAESLRELLEFENHQVEVAYSGPEGLTKAREFRPEVILCDIGLPGMDGYEVARAFRTAEAPERVFLVALTGYALPADLQRAIEAGFDRYLVKPVDLNAIKQMLAQAPSRAQ